MSYITKFVKKNTENATLFYEQLKENTILLRITATTDLENIRNGRTYASHKSNDNNKKTTEERHFRQIIRDNIAKLTKEYGTLKKQVNSVFRDVFDAKDFTSCMDNRINCLGEEWDSTFSVSSPLYKSKDYDILLMGVDHPEAKNTDLGLYDSKNNMKIKSLLTDNDRGELYKIWISNDCNERADTCIDWNTAGFGEYETLFFRETVQGMESYERMIRPTVIRVPTKRVPDHS